MALWFDLKVNLHRIGRVEIQRTEPLTEDPDREYTYEVKLNGELQGRVYHRRDAGPWALAQKACMLIDIRPERE